MWGTYDFGLVGASDTHTTAASLDEENYFGKIGAFDSDSEKRGSTPASFLYGSLVRLAAPEMVEQVDGADYLDFAGYKYWGLGYCWRVGRIEYERIHLRRYEAQRDFCYLRHANYREVLRGLWMLMSRCRVPIYCETSIPWLARWAGPFSWNQMKNLLFPCGRKLTQMPRAFSVSRL